MTSSTTSQPIAAATGTSQETGTGTSQETGTATSQETATGTSQETGTATSQETGTATSQETGTIYGLAVHWSVVANVLYLANAQCFINCQYLSEICFVLNITI